MVKLVGHVARIRPQVRAVFRSKVDAVRIYRHIEIVLQL